jgi:replicative DNA helicase
MEQGLPAEQAVLGAIFLESGSIDQIPELEPRDFSTESHQLIYKVMQWLNERDMPIDLITVVEQFEKHRPGTVSPMYISKLAVSSPTAANIQYYAKIVRSKALRRRGIEYGNEVIALSHKEFETDEDYFEAVEDLLDDLRPKQAAKMRSFKEIRSKWFDHLKSKAEKLKSGFEKYDAWAQLWRGWLYILAGRPGVGKTAYALQLLFGIASQNLNAGVVLFFSQEMDEVEVIDRMVSYLAEVNYNKLINKGGEEGFTDKEWERINRAYALCEKLQIYVQDASGVSIDQIRSTVKQFKKEHGKVAAVITDYLQIMDIPEKKGETRSSAIGRVTKNAKRIARRFKLVFIMLSQLDRAVDGEEPKMRHLKESGSIEQDADVVQFLWFNPDDQLEDSSKIIDSIFAKGRNIGLNRFRLEFKWWYQKFVETDLKAGVKDDGGSNKANKNGKGVRGGARSTYKGGGRD